MKLRVAFFVVIVCVSAIVFSCRRNQPSLVDANRPPETEIWYSPPDSTEYSYLVHLYWRGTDADGVVERYIWTITDTLVDGPLRWNPSERVADFRRGRITTRTDSVFSFTAFRSEGGVGLKKNRQAFHIAAVDDNGVIDPFPAAIEFVATVDKLPEVRFVTSIARIGGGQVETVKKLYNPAAPPDTVGMFRPFRISYRGTTTNGLIRGYRYSPLTAVVSIPGSGVWGTDLSDTLRCFPNGLADFYPDTLSCYPNVNSDAIPSGTFRLAVQTQDDAGAESALDAARFTRGVCQVVVNFDPDTEIYYALNTFFKGQTKDTMSVNIDPGVPPDTLPDGSWVTLFYRGWDSPYDSSLCEDVVNKCIGYQVQFTQVGELDNGQSIVSSTDRWRPDKPEDNNQFGTSDSTTINVGPQRYTVRARAVDEYGRPDGTVKRTAEGPNPAEVSFYGNKSPTLDAFWIESFDGTRADNDTLVWNWLEPANLNPILPSINDTIDFDVNPPQIFKDYYFVIRATGHDHPKEPLGAGVRSWMYLFRFASNPSKIETRFGSCGNWCDAPQTNALSDTFKVTIRYTWDIFEPGASAAAFNSLPDYFGREYLLDIQGRDKSSRDEFRQFMFVATIKTQLNRYEVASLARHTRLDGQRFVLKMIAP